MENNFKQNIKVLSSMTDSNAEVGIVYALAYLQDNMSEYFKALGCDGITMTGISKCFWVMSKTRVEFERLPRWLDNITLETRVQKITPVRLNLGSSILDTEGFAMIRGLQEICAMDSVTRKIRPIKSTLLPSDLMGTNDECKTATFLKMDFDLSGTKCDKEIKIDSTRIDYFGHTNNVEYAKILMSTFDGSVLKNLKPKAFEIHYISESKEGETLQIYKQKDNNNYLFEIRNKEKVICKAVLEM